MKKLLIGSLIVIAIFLIYLGFMDRDVYYLNLMDYGEAYHEKIRSFFSDKKMLEEDVLGFVEEQMRITELTSLLEDNKKITLHDKNIPIKNSLIKADLVTVSVGLNDFLSKMVLYEKNVHRMYEYIDELSEDLEKLFETMRMYCKEDIIFLGYYNPFLENEDLSLVFRYLNDRYSSICEKYDIFYLSTTDIVSDPSDFVDSTSLSLGGIEKISSKLIETIEKILF